MGSRYRTVVVGAGVICVLLAAGCRAQEGVTVLDSLDPNGASTSRSTAAARTTQRAERPPFDEATVRQALDLASSYFIAVRSGSERAFTELFAPEDLDPARALFAAESERIKAKQEAFAPSGGKALIWRRDRWFQEPDHPVPDSLKSWVVERPEARMLIQFAMMDGSVRLFQVQLRQGGRPVLLLPEQ